MNTSKLKKYVINKLAAIALVAFSCCLSAEAQDVIVNPEISYAGTPRTCTIGGIAVKGVEGYEDYVLTDSRDFPSVRKSVCPDRKSQKL